MTDENIILQLIEGTVTTDETILEVVKKLITEIKTVDENCDRDIIRLLEAIVGLRDRVIKLEKQNDRV